MTLRRRSYESEQNCRVVAAKRDAGDENGRDTGLVCYGVQGKEEIRRSTSIVSVLQVRYLIGVRLGLETRGEGNL